MPNWIALIKPLPQAGKHVIPIRRESHVALDITLGRLPRQQPTGYNGIKIPLTRSVKNSVDTTGKALLELRAHVYGATTKKVYETVCENCGGREGKPQGASSLIDFHAQHDVIAPKDGKVRVDFSVCCYPMCHKLGDTEYL